MEGAIARPLAVAEAAAALGVSPQRVRALIGSGSLRARRVGGRWLVDGDAVERRRLGGRLRARPYSSRNAWGLFAIAGGERPSGIDPAAASRLCSRLAARGLANLAPLLARRARRIALRVHPGELNRLLDDPALVRSGAAAAADLRLGLIAPDAAEGYVAAADFDGLVARHALRPSAEPNVVLRIVDGSWPFSPGARVAPLAVVAVDLLEDDDPRAQAAGRAALR
jgi:excisionase family DNA binding protein